MGERSTRGGPGWGALLLAALSTASCGGSGGGAPSLEIVACSFGCSKTGESSLHCGGTATLPANGRVAIEFNEPVALTSVHPQSFVVIDTVTGATPVGTYGLDPHNPRRVVFQPALSFDSQGQPEFGFQGGHAYSVVVPRAGTGAPVIRSLDGRPNTTELSCSFVATAETQDFQAGAPGLAVFVDVAGLPSANRTVLASGAALVRDVARDTRIQLVFDDIMDPSTLVNPHSGESTGIVVAMDLDGDADDPADQVPIRGNYTLAYDLSYAETIVTFRPERELPSGCDAEGRDRLLVVRFAHPVRDLGGNLLAGFERVVAVPEHYALPQVELPVGACQRFESDHCLDASASSRSADLEAGPGLSTLLGGGSGRLGDWSAPLGETVWNTDYQELELSGAVLTPEEQAVGRAIVRDGVFEFAHLRIGPGSVLRFEGSRPARLFVRGEASVDGVIDVSGSPAGVQLSMPCDVTLTDPDEPFYCDELATFGFLSAETAAGAPGGAGGPGGGDGGRGGDLPRPDATLSVLAFPFELGSMGLPVVGGEPVHDGRIGHGVRAGDEVRGGGAGGEHWPPLFPPSAFDLGGAVVSDGSVQCFVRQMGASGAGGGHATPGGVGVHKHFGIGSSSDAGAPAPLASGGEAFRLDELARTLNPEDGWLSGGGGGGGGGAHVGTTATTGIIGHCLEPAGDGRLVADFVQARGAGGGGGGGALQWQAGARLALGGFIDAAGGLGGSGATASSRLNRIAPGGSGAGGSVLLQAPTIRFDAPHERVDVSGGAAAPGGQPKARGGRGGAGWVRVEDEWGTAEQLSDDDLDAAITPGAAELSGYPGALAASRVWSRAAFTLDVEGPGARGGVRSRWLQPEGSYLELHFPAGAAGAAPWDLELEFSTEGAIGWRAPQAALGGASLAELFGNAVDASPVVVRFQGARVPYGSDANSLDADEFSTTAWVADPAQLNGLGVRAVRYQIIVDREHEAARYLGRLTRLFLTARGV